MSIPLVIGLTGGVGSGKSTVARIARAQGIAVVDADAIAREVAEPGGEAHEEIVALFGPGYQRTDGSLDRRALGQLVFSNEQSRRRLEALTHPHIVRRMWEQVQEYGLQGHCVVILDMPLLFEMHLDEHCDEVWVVWADVCQRIRRLVERDGLPEQEIRARMGAQLSLEMKRERADVLIDNSGSVCRTRAFVLGELERIKGSAGANGA